MDKSEAERWDALKMSRRKPGTGCAGLVVDGVGLYCDPHSDTDNERWRREEDEWAAWETLELHRHRFPDAVDPKFREKFTSWQGWMMFLLPRIAKHYGVDKEKVLLGWTRHHAPTIIYEQTGEIWIPKPTPEIPQPGPRLKPGQPCKHPGCLAHVTHPCEGCGRTGGLYDDEREQQ